ncbi:MAG: EamA family transporter [Pirellulales bacterium]|nr:EamA family transporter [Pirellulales bacterium]
MQYPGHLLLLVLAALSAAVGQLLFKKVAVKNKRLRSKFVDPFFMLGCLAFLVGPPLSVWAATRVEFSVLYVMTAFTYVFVLTLSRAFLQETIDVRKAAGVAIIVAGLVIYGVGCTLREPAVSMKSGGSIAPRASVGPCAARVDAM